VEDGGNGGTDAASDENTEQEEGNFLAGQAQRASKRRSTAGQGQSPQTNVAAALASVNLNLY
jgi:hypothetical protein